jgi:IS30 family transposase
MAYVIEKLHLNLSPEQIAGRITYDLAGESISHETIYQFIYAKETLKHIDLSPCLPWNDSTATLRSPSLWPKRQQSYEEPSSNPAILIWCHRIRLNRILI